MQHNEHIVVLKKKIAHAFSSVLLLLLFPVVSYAQSVANYSSTRTTGIVYNSIASTGESIEAWRNGIEGNYNLDDNRSYPFPIGFDFYYYGQRFTHVSVSTNGFVDFSSEPWDGGPGIGGGTYNPYGPYSQDLVTALRSQPSGGAGTLLALAPFYYDLTTQGTSDPLGNSIKRQVTGTAPYRVLTIEWINMAAYTNQAVDVSFQVKLYETTGVIEFIYGSMNGTIPTGYGFGYSLGINGTSLLPNPPSAAQLKCLQTANTNTFSNGQQYQLYTMVTSNSMYRFTPPTPAAPTLLTFSAVTESSMTLTWNDNATNEVGYVVYYSEDGVNYLFAMQVPANTTSTTVNSLQANTTYYWKVYAASEGALSNPVNGTQATLPATSYITAQSGLWTDPATWVGGVVPTPYSNVTIANGHTVIFNTTVTLNSLTVGQNGSATLRIGNDATARSLTVAGTLTISNGAQLDVNTAYVQTGHTIVARGTILNNGTLDLAPSPSAQAQLVFNRISGSQSLAGSGILTRLGNIVVNVGNSFNDYVDIFSSNVVFANTNFLTLQKGTLRLSAPVTATLWTTAAQIPSVAGLWLNHPGVVLSTEGGDVTVSGLLRVTAGTLTIGTQANQNLLYSGGTFVIEGGSLNIAGRLQKANLTTLVKFSMSGGTITAPTVGSTSTTVAPITFDVPGSLFEWYGGKILIEREGGSGAEDLGYTNTLTYNTYVSGGTLQIGNSQTPAGQTMRVQSDPPLPALIDSNATAFLVTNNLQIRGDVLIVAGTLNTNNNNITVGGNWTNSGTFTAGSATVTFDGAGMQTLGGSTATTFNNVVINKPNTVFSLAQNMTVNGTLTLTAGTLAVNSAILTLNGAFTSSGTLTSNSDGTVVYNQSSAGQTILAANYGNLTLNAYSKNFPASVVGVAGTFTVPNPATAHVTTGNTIFYNGTTAQTVTPTTANFTYNNVRIGAGAVKTLGGAATIVSLLTIDSAATLACGSYPAIVNGNVTNYGTITGNSTGGIILTGGSTAHTLGGYGLYGALTLNDAQGAVTANTLRINGTLALSTGILTTNTDTVMILSGGSVSRSGGHIYGNLQKFISAGNSTVTFEIGDATNYTPAVVQFYNTTTTGSVLAFVTAGDHPDIAGSPVEPTNSVNRYWTLTNAGVVFDSAWTTFTFVSSDVDQPGNEANFIVGRLEGTTWYTPTVGTRTATSTQARSVTAFGDFVVGGTVTANAYRSRQSGNWGALDTWETFNGTTWVVATVAPTNANSSSIRIRSGHTVNLNGNRTIDQTFIEEGATLSINTNRTLTVADGASTDLVVYGTLRSSTTRNIAILNGATIQFAAGGVYQHRRDGGAIPTATWDANSTCLVTGVTAAAPTGLGQQFGNFTWNCTGQTAAINLNGALTSVQGNVTVSSTGSLSLTLYGNQTTPFNIGGDLVVNGGTLIIKNNANAVQGNVGGDVNITAGTLQLTSNGAVTLSVNGNLSITGGTLNLSGSGNPGVLQVKGNVVHTAGTLTETGTSPTSGIVFNGTGIQNYTSGGTVSNTVNYTVNAGATLYLGPTTVLTGGGTFTLNAGGTLGIGSPAGITGTGATGNVQVTGTRTYNTAAHYVYNGTAPQVTGNGLPAIVGKLIIDNATGVSLTTSVTVSDSLKLLNGVLNIDTNTLMLNSVAYRTSGTLNALSGTVVYNQSSNGQAVLPLSYGNLIFSNYNKILPAGTISIAGTFAPGTATGHTIAENTIEFNGAAQTIPVFTYNKLRVTGSGTKTLGGASTVLDSLQLLAGTLNDGGYTLTVRGPVLNNIAHTGTGKILLDGASFAIPVSGSGTFTNVELNNPTYGAIVNSDLTINGTLTLTAGILSAPADTVVITATGSVYRPVNGGYVHGYLKKAIAASASPSTYRFEVGDEAGYTPVDFTFISVTSGGTATVRTVGQKYSDLKYSGFDTTKALLRHWIAKFNGIQFTTYDGTFTFLAADVPAGANTSFFAVRQLYNGNWYAPTSNVRTSTSTKGTGFTNDGLFTIGEISLLVYWTGAAGTYNWTDARNWSTLEVPTDQNTVTIDKPVPVVLTGPATAGTVVLANDTASLTLQSGSYLKADTLDIGNGTLYVQIANLDSLAVVNFAQGTVIYNAVGIGQAIRSAVYEDLQLTGSGTKTVSGTITVVDTLGIASGTTLNTGTSVITVQNDIVNSGSQIGSGAVVLAGGTDVHSISGGGSFTNLTLNDTQGALVSGANTTITGTLTLTNGLLTLASDNDTLVVAAGGTITRANGYIVGNLKYGVSTGASSVLLPLGTATNYLPIQLTFSDVATAGYIFIDRTTGDHPQLGHTSATVDSAQDVNAYWSIVPFGITLNGPYTIKVSFINPDELDSGVDPTVDAFVGSLWNGATWQDASIANRYADSTVLSGLLAFGDIVVGRPLARLFISVQSGSWSSSTTWNPAGIPGVKDTVIIQNGHTVTLTSNSNVTKVIVNQGGTLSIASFQLNVSGDIVLNGTCSGTGILHWITDNDTLTGTGSVAGTLTVQMSGNKVIRADANLSFYNIAIDAGRTVVNQGIVTVENITGADATSVWQNVENSKLIVTGSLLSTGTLSASANSNTVSYSGTNPQVVKPATYYDVVFTNSGTKTVSANCTINNNFVLEYGSNVSIENGVTVQVLGRTITSGTLNNNGNLLISD